MRDDENTFVNAELRCEHLAVATAAGPLRAGVWSDGDEPKVGIVLIDGSGDGTFDDWGEWPARLVSCGTVVLSHDKPGCGGSPGHWLHQNLHDRARETLAAVATLRAHRLTVNQPVGVFGVSQGGWVAVLAATLEPDSIDFVVSLSGPGVSPAAQERNRIERLLTEIGHTPAETDEAMAWIDRRTSRLIHGDEPAAVLADQQHYATRAWFEAATTPFNTVDTLTFMAGVLAFDPATVIADVSCPVLALFGAADPLVPVAESAAAFARTIPRLRGHPSGVVVFPAADHGLYISDPEPGVPRTSQLAPGLIPILEAFIGRTSDPS